MDGQGFDDLARGLARVGSRNRRSLLKGAIAGVATAAIGGFRAAADEECAAHYSPCESDDGCCAGAVCQSGLCMPGCRIEDAFYNAWVMRPGDVCRMCNPEISTTAWSPANEGMTCWSGDPDAGVTNCQQGVCTGQGAACQPLTACHLAEIDTVTGQCVQVPVAEGTPCGIGPMCHGDFYSPADACDGNGFCIGGGSQTVPCAPFRCGEDACTTSCEDDDDCAANAHCDDGHCFPDANLGEVCDEDSDCQNGICAQGVCCNQRCDGVCDVCSAETGGDCRPRADGETCAENGICCNGACNAGAMCCVAADCTAPEHGQATCDAGTCGVICDTGYARCGPTCIQSVEIPDTILGNQIAWFIEQINGGIHSLTEEDFYEYMIPDWDFDAVKAGWSAYASQASPFSFGGYVGTPGDKNAEFELITAIGVQQMSLWVEGNAPYRIMGYEFHQFTACPGS